MITTPTLYGDEPEETQNALIWEYIEGATIGWLRGERWRIADPPLWHPEGVYKVLSPVEVAQIKEQTNE